MSRIPSSRTTPAIHAISWRRSGSRKAPLSYLGWGKTTQLGYGLGLAIGAKLAHPDKLCINVWGDAAFGFTGLELETAVRERIPVLSILMNNSCMATELQIMAASTQKYRSTDIGGNYADLARSLGAYAERVTEPDAIVPAIRRGIEQTTKGVPALLEFITTVTPPCPSSRPVIDGRDDARRPDGHNRRPAPPRPAAATEGRVRLHRRRSR